MSSSDLESDLPSLGGANYGIAPTATPLGGRGGQESGAEESGFDISKVFHSLRRQWLLASVLAVICAAPLAAIAWMAQSPIYTSSAFLRIAAADTPLVFETAENSVRYDFKTFKNTQRQLILTPFVLSKAISNEKVANLACIRDNATPVEWLKDQLKVGFPGEAEIMQISLNSTDRKSAQLLVNSVVEAYMAEVIESARSTRVYRLESLERVHHEAELKARNKRSDLRKLADTLGTSDSESLSLAQQGAVQHYGLVRNELVRVRFDLMRAEGELKLLAKARNTSPDGEVEAASLDAEVENAGGDADDAAVNAASPIPATTETHEVATSNFDVAPVEFEEMVANDARCNAILLELKNYELTKELLADESLAKYEVEQAEAIASLNSDLNERREHLRALMLERMSRGGSSKGPSVANSPSELPLRVAVLKAQEAELTKEVDELEDEVRTFGRTSVDVEMMRSEIDGLDAVVTQVGSEIERTKIELQGTPRITLLSEASMGAVQDKKKPLMITAMVGMMGLILPGGLLVWRDLMHQHVDDASAVSDGLGLEMLGSIPRLPRRVNAISPGRFEEQLRDSSDSVAAILSRRARLGQHQTLLVSSAMPREGKSSLTCHLAVSLVRAGYRVIAVDCDLRRPTLHRLFDAQPAPGFAEVLSGELDLTNAVQPTGVSGLDLLTAGSGDPSIARASATGKLNEVFSSLRADYDFVLVDAGPVLASCDTRILSQPEFVDGVILSVMKDYSQTFKVDQARGLLESFGARVLGTVLAGCTESVYYSKRVNV
ncbi:polysaccharide biosynthesis tyrosine autokinase [Blastopirellula marina]|uniref:AAA domain-containing protein n=1 Tax=Blastopirellula marina TaxID=124 RepID=A0A2S8GHH2_9BACT|nr:polysaccharide biosynthesis tyrosine autokinase [Blastopirellula marina]PQO43887.1 hypothetical protein C5Y93_22135 [Blastopirellula marina]